jgi:hypothetical protein
MKAARFLIIGLILAVVGVLSGLIQDVRDAQAIPAFARKYDFACNVCHVPSFPKLNDFGNLFRDHGYQLGTDQELPTWEGLTKGYWPVSLRTTVGYQFQSKGGLVNATSGVGDVTATTGSFGFTGLDILSFGILARDITFGMVYTPGLKSAGFGTGASDSDLESAFIRLDNLQRFVGLGDKSYLMNLKVGKFELDLPFSEKRSPTLNTPFLVYHYSAGFPVIGGGLTGTVNPLGEPINDFGLGDNHPGAELAGIVATPGNGYFRYSLNAISNSDVNDDMTGGGRGFHFYGHVTQSIDGYGVVSGQRIGAYVLAGRAPTGPNQAFPAAVPGGPPPGPGTGENNQPFSRVGVDASLTWGGQVNVFGTWMFARDSKDLFINQAAPVGTFQAAHWNGGFVEADYNPIQIPKWLFIYRYDWITNTQQPDTGLALPDGRVMGNFNNTQQHTVGIRYNFHISTRTDTALHLEYSNLRGRYTAASGGDQIQNTMLVGLDFAL